MLHILGPSSSSFIDASADEAFTSSDWCNMQPDEAEVLVLNIRSSKYSLPAFIDKMSKLKVLIVTNYGFHLSELENFELLGSLPNLKRIRLEKVSIPQLCKLKSLQKLSVYMCNTRHAFGSNSMKISDALPNLVDLNIDYCNDMVELPPDICKITSLKRLSITNCHKLSALPQDIGKLENLEVLRLSSCSDLVELPESVVRLHKLHFLDISDCVNLTQLPGEIGDLLSLEKLYMWGCSSLNEPPPSVMNFEQLKHVVNVVCDEEMAALWENFSVLPNLKLEISKPVFVLSFLPGVCSQD